MNLILPLVPTLKPWKTSQNTSETIETKTIIYSDWNTILKNSSLKHHISAKNTIDWFILTMLRKNLLCQSQPNLLDLSIVLCSLNKSTITTIGNGLIFTLRRGLRILDSLCPRSHLLLSDPNWLWISGLWMIMKKNWFTPDIFMKNCLFLLESMDSKIHRFTEVKS